MMRVIMASVGATGAGLVALPRPTVLPVQTLPWEAVVSLLSVWILLLAACRMAPALLRYGELHYVLRRTQDPQALAMIGTALATDPIPERQDVPASPPPSS